MNALGILVFTLIASYLIGAIPFGYLVARWRGIDIFGQGSGNIGATNVGRVLGRRFGILVFLLDFAKGALPVVVATWIARRGELDLPKDALSVSAGLAAVLGHLFPIYLRFHGGKGVATGAGVVLVLLPWPAFGALLTWIAVLCATRYVSLSSLLAAMVLCVIRLISAPAPLGIEELTLTWFCFTAAALVFARHSTNISRLLNGNENRLQDSVGMRTLNKTIHVLALGLWFGSAIFFTFVATPVIFDTFGTLPSHSNDKPLWFPESFDKDQGTQLAGLAVGPIFPPYFLLEGCCGVLAIATALPWSREEPQRKMHKLRFLILALALATVLIGWPIAQKVSDLRAPRYAGDPVVAAAARADFATWHLCSLLLNFGTVGLVTAAMALAARLPSDRPPSDVAKTS